MSELLVSRQGPLAHVWLASNYDKKLSKQQFLNTNIVASLSLILNRQVQPAGDSASNNNTITLRLSGQLLLGIVRIYSRKTKYLLDDIHETLHKLKTSFKYASGASLGSAAAPVNLPPQRTTLLNLSRITLQDQISGHDLFYQEDLVLDEATDRIAQAVAQFPQETVEGQGLAVDEYDRSVEVGRRDEREPGADFDDADVDLDLDFDLDMDNSIEVGRDAQAALPDAEELLLDIQGDKHDQESGAGAGPGGLPDVNLDLDLPLGVTLGDTNTAENNDSDGPHEAQTPPQTAQARSVVGISDAGVVRTTKRRLVVDSSEDVERGIPNDVLRSIQTLQTQGGFAGETLTLRLTLQQKLDLIGELAAPIQLKKRKIWNLDEQLRQRCLELSTEEENLAQDSPDISADLDMDMDTNIDFDLSLPGLDSEDAVGAEQPQADETDTAEGSEETGPENLRGTAQVAEHLREFFYDQPAVTLDELMQKDTAPEVAAPLGLTHRSESGVKVSQRREATKCFFELLVLATNDCVSLEQSGPEHGISIPNDLRVRPRDLLVSKFL
ncbi:hypothetical protein HF325_004485 [Metschnikowia pulcherrima]|uniref:Cohesin complex subunit SCC1 n=1 Tax=Metschnikowia pulcherrima TaxID=27326 RepID=A0A8H7GQK2_9ASCO|nr:hypothetical protein HF325_004485 [Metschnikowia pulcherrima]